VTGAAAAARPAPLADDERWLVALDVDGTIMLETGTISDAVA